MGSHFWGKSKQEWKKTLPKLWSSLDGEIESILKFSYDALYDDHKNLFLHIACLFNHTELAKVEEYLANSFLDVRQELDVLAEKSLISMEDSYIRMHSLLVKLGEEIVRKQSIREPGQRQFLVNKKEICEVLSDDAAGSRSVIGINFEFKDELNISRRVFERMSNLQFLKLNGNATFSLSHGLSYLSPKLRLLYWDDFPMTCLPSNLNLDFLVELKMRTSKLQKLWEGIKRLPNLKWINLGYSKNLKELPNLQKLELYGRISLLELPSSIGNATNLQELILQSCSSLVEFPSSIGNATNLKKLNLGWCSNLMELPSSIGNASNLQELHLYGCRILVKLPSSIGNAILNLDRLDFVGCITLVELPNSIGNLHKLRSLILIGCSKLEVLPVNVNLKSLDLLDLSNCSSLKHFLRSP